MTPPSKQEWPRGPETDLHRAACHGSVKVTTALLSRGSINIDQGNPKGFTPLMLSAHGGHSRVVKVLLNKGANVSIAGDGRVTALHVSARNGHLTVSIQLIEAGADVDTKDSSGYAPIHLAAKGGHSQIMAALIGAGAYADCRSKDRSTPLLLAALYGYQDAVGELLRANANPLLTDSLENTSSFVPLDIAAGHGHSGVVREMIRQVGIEGCGGGSAGVDALAAAAQEGHVDVMTILMGAGVANTGEALIIAAECSREASVKLLLQQRRRRGPTVDYVNCCNPDGSTPLFRSILGYTDEEGVTFLISPRVVRLLIDAGADTSLPARAMDGGEVVFHGTPLAFASSCLRTKQMCGQRATEEQMNRLKAVCRLLLRVESATAVSWLWVSEPLLFGGAEVPRRKTARKAPASGTQLALMLPILRRRKRGVLLTPMLRYSSYP